jgi:hypothetical protein
VLIRKNTNTRAKDSNLNFGICRVIFDIADSQQEKFQDKDFALAYQNCRHLSYGILVSVGLKQVKSVCFYKKFYCHQ